MRRHIDGQQAMFVAFNIEEKSHRTIRCEPSRADAILKGMSRDFNKAYGHIGRIGIPPESLIKALLLRAVFATPSECRLCEACSFNILYRWIIDWPIEKPMWTPKAFSMNRQRFEKHDLVNKFFERVVSEGIADGLIDDDDRNGWSSSKGQKRANKTHRSVVDPDARLVQACRRPEPNTNHRPQAESGRAMVVASAWNLL